MEWFGMGEIIHPSVVNDVYHTNITAWFMGYIQKKKKKKNVVFVRYL